MATQEQQHLAQEAKRLLNEPLLVGALERMLMQAMVDLSATKFDDTSENIRLRAVIDCVHDLKNTLQTFILAGGESDGGLGDEGPDNPIP